MGKRLLLTFRRFERVVIRALVGGALPSDAVERVLSAEKTEAHWSGAGYFLTVGDAALPSQRSVFHSPMIIGTGDGVQVGFVVFVENAELTLECHAYGDTFPASFRDSEVALSVDGRALAT